MPLPPAFDDRNAVEQIVGAVVVTMIFGIVTGLALGWNEIVYYVLVGPIALLGLALVTTIVGAIVGALGGGYRARRERELTAGPAY